MYVNFDFCRKVVLLVCIKSASVMSFPARTINKTLLKVTPTTFWLKWINLSKCTKFCFADKLEVADKYIGLLKKNYLMDWQIPGLKDGISGNIWVVYWNL